VFLEFHVLPVSTKDKASAVYVLCWIELREAAWKLGIDPDAVQVPK
jgi:hypothetical protein